VNPRPCRQEGSNLYVLLSLVRVCVPLRKRGGSDSLKCEYFSPILFLVPEHVTSIVGGCVEVCLRQIPLDLVGICLRWIRLDLIFLRPCLCVLHVGAFRFSSSATVDVLVRWSYGS
jgi:hypothetical protein